jgi:penicillin G amidase
VRSSIEVFRDRYGIPHCYAASEADAFFAQGWIHADDRMWQMHYDRTRAVGRWADIAGERGVASDTFYRRFDLRRFVERDLAILRSGTLAMLDAYAAGVNARIAEGGLGREFEIAGVGGDIPVWEPADSLLVHRVRHLLMGSVRHKLWRATVAGVLGRDVATRLSPGVSGADIACVPPGAPVELTALFAGEGDGGSNNWVVDGTRTASGMPLLAGDPHRELEAPNVYVQVHIACPEWDVLGIGMPGVPGIPHFGHNARVAWSITHAMADDQDLFEVDESHVTDSRRETIDVRRGEPVEVDVVHTDFGPVIGEGLALCWTATIADNPGFDALAPMLRAETVDDMFEAMRPWVEPANSLLAADVDGTIGYLCRGRIPVRPDLDAVWLPVRASAAHAWKGFVAFEEMPRQVGSDEGFLFSANNAVASPLDAPYVGVDVAPSWRALRIVDAMRSLREATVADMAATHRDVVSLAARRVMERVRWDALDGWDGTMSALSPAAAAYANLRRELMLTVLDRSGLAAVTSSAKNRLLPGIDPEGDLLRIAEYHLAVDDTSLLGGATWDEVLAEAVDRAKQAWNGETWGELHAASQRHALADASLDPPGLPVDGDGDTVKVGGFTPTEGFRSRSGSVARYAFDVSDWDRSGWVVPLGAAGDVADEHGTDQRDAWQAGALLPAPYSRAAVEAAASDHRTI